MTALFLWWCKLAICATFLDDFAWLFVISPFVFFFCWDPAIPSSFVCCFGGGPNTFIGVPFAWSRWL